LPHFKLTLEYDGTRFHGWQAQDGVRTVEGVLAELLRPVGGESFHLQGASRTDQGVHAVGQVAGLHLAVDLSAVRLRRLLNEKLPADVFVRRVECVDDDFHARFDAVGKHYRFLLCRDQRAGILLARFSVAWGHAFDVGAVEKAARSLVGELDFASFQCKTDEVRETTVRRLDSIHVCEAGPFVWLDFWGKGFLYKMVRTLSGTLLEVARGRLSPSAVEAILAARDRTQAGPTAAAQGLCLVEVFYDGGRYEAGQRRRRDLLDVWEPLLGGGEPSVEAPPD